MAVINNLKTGGTKLPESVFYGFWIAEVSINNAAMGYNIYKIYDNGTMDVLEVTVDGTIQNDVKGITYTISGKVLTPNASAGTLTHQEDGTLYQLYNGQLPLTFTRKLFSDGALSVTENGTYKPLIHNGYASVEVNVQGGDYDIDVVYNDDGTQSLYITDSDSSIDRNATIRELIGGGLTEIVIPEGTTSIKSYAFYRQGSLKSVTIPNSVTRIGTYAFYNCTGLTNIEIPNSVDYVDDYSFTNCTKLTSVDMSNSVAYYIGDYAFSRCTSLTSIKMSNNLQTISGSAFQNCTSLESITIPQKVSKIGSYAFEYCSSLTNVYYDGTIEKWCNIYFNGLTSNPVYLANNFYINNDLVTEIEIPSTIKAIKSYAFCGFSNVTSITIPSSVTSIGSSAFYNCSSLAEMTILATTPPTLSNTNAISTATTTIYIPNGTLEAYQSATNWSSFASKFVELEV